MVARTPPKERKMVAPPPPPRPPGPPPPLFLSPTLIRETVDKVDKSIARLQELQITVTGGKKVISGVSLSPRSTRGYLRTSLRCKQESLRIKNHTAKRSPPGKLPTNTGDWKRMSLPAMLLGETVGEILHASQFARQIVEAVNPPNKPNKCKQADDPKTPLTQRKNNHLKPTNPENSELRVRRKREKQVALQLIRSESDAPSLQRAKSKINFKVSPLHKSDCDKENCRYIANRVSPRNRPWARKTVLFPNPLFHSSPTSQKQRILCKTKSPVMARSSRQSPHKFLIKSPPSASKFHVKIRSPPKSIAPTRSSPSATKFHVMKIRSPPLSISPTRSAILIKKSPKVVSAAAKLRRSFSPSRLANRLVSPLKSRKSVQNKSGDGIKVISGLKQRPSVTPMRFSTPRI